MWLSGIGLVLHVWDCGFQSSIRKKFLSLWDSIAGKEGVLYAAPPRVWSITYEKIEKKSKNILLLWPAKSFISMSEMRSTLKEGRPIQCGKRRMLSRFYDCKGPQLDFCFFSEECFCSCPWESILSELQQILEALFPQTLLFFSSVSDFLGK